eukprot:TRINITY_DN942_c0_g1_i1.p1 TRINITY_DN942_c0_g1~~TRINITY_DN942_c0_g1_i1.p1  ORF type:complete len:453 (-),score=29.71 TRINITY_DN942_c0_g1_i1:153-1511(-)
MYKGIAQMVPLWLFLFALWFDHGLTVNPMEFPNIRSTHSHVFTCSEDSYYLEICTIGNVVCFDGTDVILITQNSSRNTLPVEKDPMCVYRQYQNVPWTGAPKLDLPLPPRGKVLGIPRYSCGISAKYRTWESIQDVTWTNNPVYFALHPVNNHINTHIYHWMQEMAWLWVAQVYNDTWGGIYPSLEESEMIFPAKFQPNKTRWINALFNTIVPPKTTLWSDADRAKYNTSHLMCTPKGVFGGLRSEIMLGPKDCQALREKVHKLAGVELWPQVSVGSMWRWRKPPFRLLLTERLHGRIMANLEGVKSVIESLGIPYDIWRGNMTSFAAQVHTFASVGVVLSLHGAGLTNMLWMRYQSVVIEIFPYKMVRFGYKYLSDACNLYHMPIYTYTPPTLKPPDPEKQEKWEKKCNASFNAQVVGECYNTAKHLPVTVDLVRLRSALIDAFGIIGYAL